VNKKYSEEFQTQAVSLATKEGVQLAANTLGMPTKTLYAWVAAHKAVERGESPLKDARGKREGFTKACVSLKSSDYELLVGILEKKGETVSSLLRQPVDAVLKEYREGLGGRD